MSNIRKIIFCFICLTIASPAFASGIFFDVQQRKEQLASPEYKIAKKMCMAEGINLNENIPKPIMGLKTTKGYGSDNRLAEFTWHVMILSGRALAGDEYSTSLLKKSLLKWANSNALQKSDNAHDTYYALKRYMLPIIVSLSVIENEINKNEKKTIVNWIDSIVPKLDKKFDGDVDFNNHRYLADSTLMAWGAFKNDAKLYNIGKQGFLKALKDAMPDGSLPLETRRGSRATWYMRHALSSLTVIAEIDRAHGGNLYNTMIDNISLSSIINYFISAIYSPIIILPHAAQNYIPGPHKDYTSQDIDFIYTRGHNRHYMAFAEAYINQNTIAAKRLNLLINNKTKWRERPYIDEFVGGNASCFFWKHGREI